MIVYSVHTGFMPFWVFTLGKHIFERGKLSIPYGRIAMFAVGLIIPLSIGFLVQKKLPKLCRLMIRIMKPFSAILIIFIVVFAILTNLYLFKLFSWQVSFFILPFVRMYLNYVIKRCIQG